MQLAMKCLMPLKCLKVIPSLAYIFILYNIILFTNGNENIAKVMDYIFITLPLVSGSLAMSIGDILIILGVIALFIELMKSASATDITLAEHGLSVLTFFAFLLELLLVQGAATSTFLLLTLLQLLDVKGLIFLFL